MKKLFSCSAGCRFRQPIDWTQSYHIRKKEKTFGVNASGETVKHKDDRLRQRTDVNGSCAERSSPVLLHFWEICDKINTTKHG